MENEPLLFIDTITNAKKGEENQTLFDSRVKPKKDICEYRLEDLKAMLLYKIHVLSEIKTSNAIYHGLVVGINDNYVKLRSNNLEISISLKDINGITLNRD